MFDPILVEEGTKYSYGFFCSINFCRSICFLYTFVSSIIEYPVQVEVEYIFKIFSMDFRGFEFSEEQLFSFAFSAIISSKVLKYVKIVKNSVIGFNSNKEACWIVSSKFIGNIFAKIFEFQIFPSKKV